MWNWWRKLRRRRFAEHVVSDATRTLIRRAFPIAEKLPSELEARLYRMTEIFVAEKNFEGAKGFEITDEVRYTIAASASILLVGKWKDLGDPLFEELTTIIVYPSAYSAKSAERDPAGVVKDGDDQVRLGESWGNGAVVLSWSDAKRGALNFRDGSNVVVHEFAHQLDQADGEADGVPELDRASLYDVWSDVFTREFHALESRNKKRDVLDKYGATNPAEFFAVATEAFFEKGVQMKANHPELYATLGRYYGVDPAAWK